MKSNYYDEWSDYIRYRAKYYYKRDERYYNECVRDRMKIEKTLRLLNIRLNKLQNVLLSTNSYKLFVINCIDIHPDVLTIMKTIMINMYDQNISYYF